MIHKKYFSRAPTKGPALQQGLEIQGMKECSPTSQDRH